MRRFIGKFLLLLPIFAGVIWFNYTVDPANLFQGPAYSWGVAQILLKKQNVANVVNYDERLVQKYYLDGLSDKNDVIVLGSSRSMQIRSHLFSDRSFFNHGVSGAIVPDYFGIYQLYVQRDFKPRLVILGVDPWILNFNNGHVSWESIKSEYYAGLQRAGLATNDQSAESFGLIPDKYFELISPAYFQESVRTYLNNQTNGAGHSVFYATLDTRGDVPIKLSDGSLTYSREVENRSVEQTELLASDPGPRQIGYSLQGFSELDASYKQQLEAFVTMLQNDGVEVVLFLAPYHPLTYQHYLPSKDYPMVTAAEEYFRAMAHQYQIPVLGSYDPAKAGCDETEFFDGMHPRPICVDQIFMKSTWWAQNHNQ